MLPRFKNITKTLISKDDSVLVAVSGGIDSMVMLNLLSSIARKWSLKLVAAHVNYKKRGVDSDKDQVLVEKTCRHLNIPCEVKIFDKNVTGENFQNEARKFRYDFFEKIAKKYNLNKIATAHNLDDQAETIIAHILRGSGINGLRGMESKTVLRPLLSFERKEISEYAKKNKIAFREDKTNKETHYQRNKIRHLIIPRLEEINVRALSHINDLADDAKQVIEYIKKSAMAVFEKEVKINKSSAVILQASYSKYPSVIRYELLKSMFKSVTGTLTDLNRDQLNQMDRISQSKTGSYKLPHGAVFSTSKGILGLSRIT